MNPQRGREITFFAADLGQRIHGQAEWASMDKENAGPEAATMLGLPGLASVCRAENAAEVAHGPAVLAINKTDAAQGERLPGLLHLPGLSPIGTVEDRRARPTDQPEAIAARADGVKIPIVQHVGRDSSV